MNRRTFLLNSGTLGLALTMGVSSCSRAGSTASKASNSFSSPKLPKIRASMDRGIKETVGLRPYRLSGPRLDVQALDQKTIIHNYGHGGSFLFHGAPHK